MLTFAHPEVLWFLALVPVMLWWRGRRGLSSSVRFSSTGIARTIAGARRSRCGKLGMALRALSLGLLVVGLARPQLGTGKTVVEANGIDIMLAVDVSSSMEAHDFEVDRNPVERLEVVKRVVAKFIEARPDDRIGLVAFAGKPYLVSPLTLDHDWLLKRLDALETGMVEDGTAIGSAIASGLTRLRDQEAGSRIMILLTDGMNNAGKVAPEAAAEAAEALKIKIYTIGAGTRGEAPVPMVDAFGRTRMAMARVDIDEETLTKVAKRTKGQYYRATDTRSLRQIYQQIDKLEKTKRSLEKYFEYTELFGWAVLTSLLFLGLELGLASTVFRRLP